MQRLRHLIPKCVVLNFGLGPIVPEMHHDGLLVSGWSSEVTSSFRTAFELGSMPASGYDFASFIKQNPIVCKRDRHLLTCT